MPITPEGRFIPVNMDRCQDLMGGLFEHVTPVARSLLTEFFNKLMRVQRKHDIVQAKLKKERQQGKGGTPGAADPNPKVPPPVGKARGTNPPPKGEKKTPPRRSVRFQNQKEKGKP